MQTVLHATSVALDGRGLMICGASGSGKSGLALAMMALGAVLIADDQTRITRERETLWLAAPETIHGMIEARGIGILNAEATRAPLAAILDLDTLETARLPPHRTRSVLGCDVALLHNSSSPFFPGALMQYLKAGRKS